ncbi:hypothetical protein EBN87_23250 [Salmonella enterica]|nr:hypothetical protein [Salmonella enterica]
MHDLECMKMHDFWQAEKAAKPSPGLASMRFSLCMRIDLLIKKRAGSASPRGGGRGLCIPDQEKTESATSFLWVQMEQKRPALCA